MSTKRSRQRVARERAKAEANRRYPADVVGKSRGHWLRIGFIAGAMWHPEHPWHTPESADVEIGRQDHATD